MVIMLAFYSEDPSSNPDEVYSFFWNICLKRSKINKLLTAHSVISYFTRSRKFYNMEYSTSDNMQLELYKCLN